jgi:hypothetical protein
MWTIGTLKWIYVVTRLFTDRCLRLRLSMGSDERYGQLQHYKALQLAAERIDGFRMFLTMTVLFL